MGDKGGCPTGRGKSPLHSIQLEKEDGERERERKREREKEIGIAGLAYQGKVDPSSMEMPRSRIIYSSTLDENFRS